MSRPGYETRQVVADSAHDIPVPEQSDRVGVLDILLVLARRLRLLVLGTAIACLLGAVLAFVLRPTFTATAIILPPQQQSSISSMLGQLGALASLGGGSPLSVKSPAEMYIGFLKSRSIGDEIIRKFHLADVYKEKKMEDLRKTLASHTEIDSGKDGLIRVSVRDHDPNRASEIANAYVDGLYQINSRVAVTEAAQRRVFFDQQLTEEKAALAAAEDALRATQQRTGLIALGGQAVEIIRSIAELRAQISSREVELQSLRTYATDRNPDVTRLQEELATMRGQLSKLENNQQGQTVLGDITVPAGKLPESSLEYARKLREVKYHETLYELLAKQYEAARIDEAKSAPLVQVVDRAVAPDKKTGPPRLLLILASAVTGLICACVWIVCVESWEKLKTAPGSSEKVVLLRHLLRRSPAHPEFSDRRATRTQL